MSVQQVTLDPDKPILAFGGPYSNLSATQAILNQANSLGLEPGQVICTGDVVAYGAEAEQTSSLLRQSDIHIVMGNCEESLANEEDDCGCGFEPGMLCSTLSRQWYRYASTQISEQTRRWMRQLPRALDCSFGRFQFRVIHGGVQQINRFLFASDPETDKQQELDRTDSDFIVAGHCGIPFGQVLDRGAWLNAGVIGLPANDATPDGWYMMLNPTKKGVHITWHRLVYDPHPSYHNMKSAGLTDYAETLITGLWPSTDILPEPERQRQGQALKIPSIHLAHPKCSNTEY